MNSTCAISSRNVLFCVTSDICPLSSDSAPRPSLHHFLCGNAVATANQAHHMQVLNTSRFAHRSSDWRRKLFSVRNELFYLFRHQLAKFAVSLFLIVAVAHPAP